MSKLPKLHRKPFSGYSNSKKVSFARSTFGVISFVSRSFKRIALSLICLVGAIGFSTISPSSASAGTTSSNTILYATALTTLTTASNPCSFSSPCSLATALTKVTAGETIDLVTPGSTAHYDGNFTINTANTSKTAPITIQPAPGVTNPTLDGQGKGTVLTIDSNAFVNLNGVTITGGQAASGSYGPQGPGVRGGNGGGIKYSGSGSLIITDSTISGNSAGNGGNGASFGGTGGNGGGISYVGTGSLTIADSTISGNFAGNGGEGYLSVGGTGGNGGGIYYHSSGSFTISNATITDNAAGNGGTVLSPGPSGDGGGIYNNGDTTTIANSTISGNSVLGGGDSGLGSGIYNASGTVNLAADLLATPSAPSAGGECSGGGFIDYGYNVADDNTCGLTSSTSRPTATAAELLGALQNNGGSTLTILPLPGNPAIGLIPTTATIGNTKLSLCPATDQRGFATVSGVNCDAGSLQLASVLYAAATPLGSATCADATDACNLTTALGDVGAGGVIDLVTPGSTAHYDGNFTLNTNDTSATAPVTIQPAPGVTNPTLDGQGKGTV
ncbi:choice-of-anchor Q domain-containing protein [Acidithrix ferrooxidans]|nr:choice-of-anchor Q domain-containing protein [Acidithrix ferrooxidans]